MKGMMVLSSKFVKTDESSDWNRFIDKLF